MIRLTSDYRRLLADKLLDAANLGLGTLLFAQLVSDRKVSTSIAAAGFVWWICMGIASTVVAGRRRT